VLPCASASFSIVVSAGRPSGEEMAALNCSVQPSCSAISAPGERMTGPAEGSLRDVPPLPQFKNYSRLAKKLAWTMYLLMPRCFEEHVTRFDEKDHERLRRSVCTQSNDAPALRLIRMATIRKAQPPKRKCDDAPPPGNARTPQPRRRAHSTATATRTP
jgi:hypothetical protein